MPFSSCMLPCIFLHACLHLTKSSEAHSSLSVCVQGEKKDVWKHCFQICTTYCISLLQIRALVHYLLVWVLHPHGNTALHSRSLGGASLYLIAACRCTSFNKYHELRN